MSRTPPNIEVDATLIRDPLIGTPVLGYRILRVLGEGGMGLVYEAEDPAIGRKAAVKVLRAEVANDEAVVARFRAEARAANAARHRGIVDVFGFVTLPDGREAIVMEFLQGAPLEDELRARGEHGLPLPQALTILDEIAAVLVAAHAKGLVHRDLKTSNVFWCRDDDGKRHVKVLDFGIAKTDAPKAKTTVAIMGTPDYMSPEQAAGRAAHPSMDLYSLGCIAFELFTGRMPFEEQSITALLLAHQHKQPPKPSSLRPSLPPAADKLVATLLAKQPEDRFRSAAEVRVAIQDVREALAGTTRVISRPARRPAVLAFVAVAVLSAGGAALWLRGLERAELPAPALPADPPAAVVIEAPPPSVARDAIDELAVLTPPPVEPRPSAPDRPKKSPVAAAALRAILHKRAARLGAQLTRLEAAGTDVTLERSQLRKLEARLSDDETDGKLLEQIDIALRRLEEGVR